MSLRALFDAAAEVYSGVTMWSERAPSAIEELASWASGRGLEVRRIKVDPNLVIHLVCFGPTAHYIQVLERLQ